MVERIDKRFLGATTGVAIAVGNFAVPATEAAQNEHTIALADKRAALTKVGGHAVKESGSATSSRAARRRHANNGGTPSAGPIPIGCTSPDGAIVSNGPRSRRRVALTFDDGPSLKQTPRVLDILERSGVDATFFVEGKHVRGREGLLAEILAEGHEIANHSYHHPEYPGYGELANTNRRIEGATGFRPCLFRPPYGLVNGSVASAAGRLGMEIVQWDVNSHDDKHPGAGAIRSNVVNQAQPGSIILLHDGGHHPQTVRALPGIIHGLKERGFGFTTATELLGGRYIYK